MKKIPPWIPHPSAAKNLLHPALPQLSLVHFPVLCLSLPL